jgi:hypothetical protein
MVGRKKLLRASTNGYSIETEVAEKTDIPGGPTVMIASGNNAILWEMVDHQTWQASYQNITTDASVVKQIAYPTTPKQSVLLRLDVPAKKGLPIRFFLDNKLLFQTSLSENLTNATSVYLVRQTDQGIAEFHYFSLKSYQQ